MKTTLLGTIFHDYSGETEGIVLSQGVKDLNASIVAANLEMTPWCSNGEGIPGKFNITKMCSFTLQRL